MDNKNKLREIIKTELNKVLSEQENTPMVGRMKSDYINIKDSNGNDIFVGSVIEHSGNLYVIKHSENQKRIVARKEPLNGQTASWRDMDWIERVSPYIKMVGTVLFDDAMYQRFKHVLPKP
jgi:hypothetical protein